MKTQYLIISFFALLFSVNVNAQNLEEWRKMKPEERKGLINKMSPEERKELLQRFRENMMIDELDVPSDKQEDFRRLYSEYQESQSKIKSRFAPKTRFDSLSDTEAQQELDESFIIGQQLLDNRKKYCEKFKKVVKPQQVLRMFESEGKMRDKVMDRNHTPRTRSDNARTAPSSPPRMMNRGGSRR